MELSAEDREAIAELVCDHAGLFDGDLTRLHEVFTSDVVYDLPALTAEPLVGLPALRRAAAQFGGAHALVPHVAGTEVPAIDDRTAIATSDGLAVTPAGALAVTYLDVCRREADGWRLSDRRV